MNEPAKPPLTPEDAYDNVLRFGWVVPWFVMAPNLVCPPDGTFTWSFTATETSVWTRSLELPADMQVESVTIGGLPVPVIDEPPTHLVEAGPASVVPAMPGIQAPNGLCAYKVMPLRVDNAVALARYLLGLGQTISITCRHRNPAAPSPSFRLILHCDALQPDMQQKIMERQLAMLVPQDDPPTT